MAGAGMQRPDLPAITQPARRGPEARELTGEDSITTFLRDPAHYPLFAKPRLFGPRLWSVRLLVLMTPARRLIHRAVAKMATGQNPADNFRRQGNMLGAIDLTTGQVARVVAGTGAEMTIDGRHPDTGRPIVGTQIPDWTGLLALVKEAARLLLGIRTQSWDIALTDSRAGAAGGEFRGRSQPGPARRRRRGAGRDLSRASARPRLPDLSPAPEPAGAS